MPTIPEPDAATLAAWRARGLIVGETPAAHTPAGPLPSPKPAAVAAVVAGLLPATGLRTEAEFTEAVLGLARRHGWRACHYRPAFSRGRRVTPVSGDPGGPDLTLARGGVVLLAELKLDAGRLRPEQHVWAKEIGPNYRLWRPSMWEAIVAELAGRFGKTVHATKQRAMRLGLDAGRAVTAAEREAVRRLLRRLSGTELQALKTTDIPDAQRRLPTRVVVLCPCDIKEDAPC